MSSPSTFKAEPGSTGIDWNDQSTLHLKEDGSGVLNGFKSIRGGTLAELIRFVLTLPESEQPRYVIEKSGDRTLSIGDILSLARRPDFPAA